MKIFAKFMLRQDKDDYFYLDKNKILELDPESGKIKSISEGEENEAKIKIEGLLSPSFSNAHSHAFQIAMRGKADNPNNFKDWVDRYLYPTVDSFNEAQLRKSLKQFFRIMMRNGISTLGEFHYFHHKSERDFYFDTVLMEEAAMAGIRLSLLQSAYDLGTREAQKKFHSGVNEFIGSLEMNESWLQKNGLSERWAISVAPHSLHGCSAELLKEAVNWAGSRNLKWHIHLAEQKDDIIFSEEKYGKSPLYALDKICENSLNNNCCLVHACWLSKQEIGMFNEREINLVYNPMTNMYLGDGITETSEMNWKKSRVALGTDSNNAFNMFQEAKTMELLQRVKVLEMGILDPNVLYSSITSFSGELLNIKTGRIEENYFADFIELDIHDLLGETIEELEIHELLNHLIFSGMESRYIKRLFIGGVEKNLN